MSITEMSLPVDIPWKRMGVSKDMIDPKGGDLKFPEKWRSSISVFYHEPAEIPPEYCDRKITYLKIICTITNYSVEGDDISVLKELRERHGDFYVSHDFDANVTKSYPCYGALVQVGVYPNSSDPLAKTPEIYDYPIITAFQPRKREEYEILTQSGEATSQSGTKLNVSKGTTNTSSSEHLAVEGGGASGGAAWGVVSWTTPQGQHGDITNAGTQKQDVTTTDASRDKRESTSYSTNINQLYTLLQGYHLGTNRALFFIQPRPHIQDQKFSFIRGLRRLEGIQEFFLIVDRPASIPGICVEVALETAHIKAEKAYEPKLIPLSELYAPGNLDKTAEALGLNLTLNQDYQYYADLVGIWNSSLPGQRLAVEQVPDPLPDPSAWTVIMAGTPLPYLLDVVGKLPDIGTEDIALIFEEYESNSGDFFVTGRKLYTCMLPFRGDVARPVSADIEKSTASNVYMEAAPASIVFWNRYQGRSSIRRKSIDGTSRAFELNCMVRDINEALQSSIGSNYRFQYGEVSFLETDFILKEFRQFIRLLKKAGIQDISLNDVDMMRHLIERGLGRRSGVRTILDLETLSTNMIASDLDTSQIEARRIHRDILVSALKTLDPTTVKPDAPRLNVIQERFMTDFNRERLRKLIDSAHLKTYHEKRLPKRTKKNEAEQTGI